MFISKSRLLKILDRISNLEERVDVCLDVIHKLEGKTETHEEYLRRFVVPLKDYLEVEVKTEYVDDPRYAPTPHPQMPVYKLVKRKK
jgi:hypothetical protein